MAIYLTSKEVEALAAMSVILNENDILLGIAPEHRKRIARLVKVAVKVVERKE